MATTAAAIRDAMALLVKGITPAIHAHQKFRQYREYPGQTLDAHAEANPASCLRQFSIRNLNDRGAPAVTNNVTEEVSETFAVVTAYPVDARHGAQQQLDLDDVIASDQRQIHHVLHVANSPAGATVLRLDDAREEVGSPPVAILSILRYRVDYYWSLT